MPKKITRILTVLSVVVFSSTFLVNTSFAQQRVIEATIPSSDVTLDTTLYLPNKTPAPAILVAHGFGGNKNSEKDLAEQLSKHGYVVMTWSARGFGNSTGQITMNAPDKEVADASRLIDYLQKRSEVKKDASGNPVVGAMGASYGGALSLLLAETDKRVKAISADITWNNLQQSLFPQNALNVSSAGVFKKTWAGTFFSFTALQNSYLGQCGNFAEIWCQAFQDAVNSGAPTQSQIALMNQSSPDRLISNIKVPTLLMQGEEDSLFPLSESFKTVAGITNNNPKTPVSLIWHSGGHDGGNPEADRLTKLSIDWFDKYLLGKNLNFPKFTNKYNHLYNKIKKYSEIADCPICYENKLCIPLECCHMVCLSCWDLINKCSECKHPIFKP